MKMLTRYLIVIGLAVLGAVVIITYQNNMAKKTDQSIYRYTQPLIDKEIYCIVVGKSITKATERTQSANAMLYSLKIDYIEIKTQNPSSFVINFRFNNSITSGDTVIKNKGEEVLHLHKKSGTLISIPIR